MASNLIDRPSLEGHTTVAMDSSCLSEPLLLSTAIEMIRKKSDSPKAKTDKAPVPTFKGETSVVELMSPAIKEAMRKQLLMIACNQMCVIARGKKELVDITSELDLEGIDLW